MDLRETLARAAWYAAQDHFNAGPDPVGFTNWAEADDEGRGHMLAQADGILSALRAADLCIVSSATIDRTRHDEDTQAAP
jgi:hypothetical protein